MNLGINVVDGKGFLTLEESDGLLNNAYLSLTIPRGSWWYSINFGSRMHLLKREKDTPSTRNRAVEYAKEALAWLIETKRAKAVSAVALTVDGKLALAIEISRFSGDPVTFTHFVPVGK